MSEKTPAAPKPSQDAIEALKEWQQVVASWPPADASRDEWKGWIDCLCAVTRRITRYFDHPRSIHSAAPLTDYKELVLAWVRIPLGEAERPSPGKMTHAWGVANDCAGRLIEQLMTAGHHEADDHTSRTPEQSPRRYLLNWQEILACLEMRNNDTSRNHVRQQNEKYAGPIIFLGKGSQPKVPRDKLLEWWNRLEIMWETEGAGRNADATLQAQHDYGRDEKVLPDISGHVKKKRRKGS